jgi:hypothetical protein
MDADSFDEHVGKNETDGIIPTKQSCRLVVEDVASIAGNTRTEIDLADRVIRKTWKIMGFAYSRTYHLDRHVVVHIKDKSSIVEGYSITSFGVYIASRGRKIQVSSADDFLGARFIQSRIFEFLKESSVKCPADMRPTVCGV